MKSYFTNNKNLNRSIFTLVLMLGAFLFNVGQAHATTPFTSWAATDPNVPFPMTSCGEITVGGIYTIDPSFDNDSLDGNGNCFVISSKGVTIDGTDGSGGKHTINGNVNGNGYNSHDQTYSAGYSFELDNIHVVGTITSIGGSGDGGATDNGGYNGGSVTIKNSITGDVSVLGGNAVRGAAAGNGGNIVIENNSITGIVSVNGGGDNRNPYTSGAGGSITIQNNSTTGDVSANGGSACSNGGTITIKSNSTTGDVSANSGGYCASAGVGGDQIGTGGVIDITNSTTTSVSATGSDLGNGGSINISSSIVGDLSTDSGTLNGIGGSISISGSNVNVSGKNISSLGRDSDSGIKIANSGTLTITYSGTLTTTGTTLSALAHLIIQDSNNQPGDLGAFAGGAFPLLPGATLTDASQCASLSFPGTYNASGLTGGDCMINHDGITLDGHGTGTLGNVSSANGVDGSVDGSTWWTNAASFVLQNITVTGSITSGAGGYGGGNGGSITINNSTTTSVTAGAGGSSNNQGYNASPGSGGSIFITDSTTGSLTTRGGGVVDTSQYRNGSYGANGGSITIISSGNLNLSGKTITTGLGSSGLYNSNGSNGSLTINYTGILTANNTTLSALGDLNINGIDGGVFSGGPFPTLPGTTISSASLCNGLYFPGTYTVTSFTGDCTLQYNGITLDGGDTATITGNITSADGVGGIVDGNGNPTGGADGIGYTLENITVTGSITTGNGGAGGGSYNSSGVGAGGNGGSVDITNSTVGSIITGSGGSAGSDNSSDGNTGGNGGSINITDSTTTGSITTGGGGSAGGSSGPDGSGGNITITSTGNLNLSNISITAGAGAVGVGYSNGSNGSLTITYSGTLNVSGATASALSDLKYIWSGNTVDLGAFAGGSLPPPPSALPDSTITTSAQCSNLFFGGTYYIGADITGDCHITATTGTTTIIGNTNNSSPNHQYTIHGNVIGDGVGYGANGNNFELDNIHVTGNVSANGATDDGSCNQGGGNGGSITLNNDSVSGSIGAVGAADVSEIDSCSYSGGGGGTILISNSTTTSISANGGFGGGGGSSGGGGGNVSVSNSNTGDISVEGQYGYGYNSGGGSISVTSSVVGNLSADSGWGINNSNSGGAGGSISINNSVTGSSISANGGDDGRVVSTDGGQINITGNNVDISNKNISLGAGYISPAYGQIDFNINSASNGSLTITYSSSLNVSGATASALAHLIIQDSNNQPGDLGAFAGGAFPLSPGATITDASQCAGIFFPGTYYVSGTIGSCNIPINGVTLDGRGTATISGNVIGDGVGYGANGNNFELDNITVTGSGAGNVTSYGATNDGQNDQNGGNGGNIVLNNDHVTGMVAVDGSVVSDGMTSGSAGSITISNSTTGDINANGGDGNATGGNGGTITISNSTTTAINSNGGNGYDDGGTGGSAGTITISNSTTGAINSNGSSSNDYGYDGGNGGTITISTSTTGDINSNGGIGDYANGGNGGTISITSSGNLDLSNKSISAAGGVGAANGTNGSLTITYTNDITTNSSTYFNNVADLKINTVDYGPWNGLFNPQIYYFNSTADGGGNDGNWNNPANWWLYTNYTNPANSVPNGLNPITVGSDITENADAPSLANVSNLSATENTSEGSTLTANNSTYTFNVYAYTTVNNGKYYSSTPSSVTVTDDSSNSNFAWDLAWDAVDGATGYKIVGTTPAGTFGMDVGDVTAYTYDGSSNPTDTNVSPIANGTHTSPLIVMSLLLRNGAKNYLNITTAGSTFTDTSSNQGAVTGKNHTFNATSTNAGNVTGTTTFNGNSINSGTTTGVTTFNDASLNTGVVINSATTTFNGDLASSSGLVTNAQGATSTPITRVFTSNASTTRNYTTEAGHNNWFLVASNAVVDLTGAIYDRTTNMFQALLGGLFISGTDVHGDPTHVTPVVVMSSPVAGTNVKWSPNINWDTANNNGGTCEYSYDNFASDDHFVSCASGGSDIPRPSTLNSYTPSTQYTLYLRATDPKGNVTQTGGLAFSYDNTQPVWTACGTDLLDESRTYYLTANTSADCHISADNVTLEGASTTNSNGFTLNANVIAASAYNVNFSNININGSIPTTGNFTVSSTTISNPVDINGSLTSDATSTFAGATVESGATLHGGNFTGNVINNGTITGNFTMNGSSSNNGTTTGSLTLNASSTNVGTVTGNLIFNMLTAASSTVTFSGSTAFAGTGHVGGSVKDSNNANITKWIFSNTSSNTGYTKGNATFNDSSTNTGTIVGTAYFSDSSSNTNGTVNGNANIYYNVVTPLTGTVTGTKTYYSYPNDISFGGTSGSSWSNIANWYTDTTLTTHLGRLPVSGENVVLFASTTISTSTTGNIFIANNGVTLTGAANLKTIITGTVNGNGAYGGSNAYSFNLARITVTGTTTANGGTGGSTGGNGGTITLATSTTANIIANGGNGTTKGGNGGTISVVHSLEIASSTALTANGGDATSCGRGGNGGTITLSGSTYDIQTVNAGHDRTTTIANGGSCANPPGGSSGSSGSYTPPSSNSGFTADSSDPGYSAPSPSNTPSNPGAGAGVSVGGGGSYVYAPGLFTPGVLNGITLPNINIPGKLSFKPLPTFNGTGTKSFNFLAPISNFLNGASISWNGATALQAYITSLGITRDQDLVALRSNAVPATTTKDIPGLFKVSVSTLPTKTNGTFTNTSVPVTSYFTSNSDIPLSQSVTILPGSTITISVTPATKVKKITGTWNGQSVIFTLKKGVASVTLTVPSSRGTYTLKTNASPIPLTVTVKPPVVASPPPPSPIQSIFDKVLGWFGW